ncbi:MAG: hypothetical protein JNM85_00235 [Chthonomonas sp.]|nr:hypothetical protein [Chthonomonas sp.]
MTNEEAQFDSSQAQAAPAEAAAVAMDHSNERVEASNSETLTAVGQRISSAWLEANTRAQLAHATRSQYATVSLAGIGLITSIFAKAQQTSLVVVVPAVLTLPILSIVFLLWYNYHAIATRLLYCHLAELEAYACLRGLNIPCWHTNKNYQTDVVHARTLSNYGLYILVIGSLLPVMFVGDAFASVGTAVSSASVVYLASLFSRLKRLKERAREESQSVAESVRTGHEMAQNALAASSSELDPARLLGHFSEADRALENARVLSEQIGSLEKQRTKASALCMLLICLGCGLTFWEYSQHGAPEVVVVLLSVVAGSLTGMSIQILAYGHAKRKAIYAAKFG